MVIRGRETVQWVLCNNGHLNKGAESFNAVLAIDTQFK